MTPLNEQWNVLNAGPTRNSDGSIENAGHGSGR